jgi:hypothetical protein
MKSTNLLAMVLIAFCLLSSDSFCAEYENKNWFCMFKRNPYQGMCNDCLSCACNPRSITSFVTGGVGCLAGVGSCARLTANMNSHRYDTCNQALYNSCFPTECYNTEESCCATFTWINTLVLFTSLTITALAWNPCCDRKGCNISCSKKEKNLPVNLIDLNLDDEVGNLVQDRRFFPAGKGEEITN